ncbi:Nuclear localized protein [Hirschfeldia incana]|nr:Nuclear localized protein [Hirschfeldia incana]
MNNSQEEEVEQWEALDLGDSELPSFLRPCKRKSPSRPSLQQPTTPHLNPKAGFSSNTNHQTLRRCSSLRDHFLEDNSYPRSLIPGPAATVQVAIRRKMNKDPKSFDERGEPIPTQEFICKAAEEPDWDDKDFSEDPWVSAVDYIRRQGLLSKGGNAIGTPLSEIKSVSCSWGKVDQVVAIVKTCTPNGLGDMMVTLKDPTGTIDASVHRKLISESEFGRDIRVGAVVILNKVAVCAPSRSSRYLNITLKNISKVITKDTPVVPNESHSETSAKNPVPVNENEEALRMRPKVFPVEQGTTQGIMNSLRRNATEGSEASTDVEMEETNPTEEGSSWVKGVANNQFQARTDQTHLGKHDSISQAEIAASSTTSNTQEQQLQEDVATGTDDTADDIRPAKKISRSREPQSCELESVKGNSDEVTPGSKVNKSQPMASSSLVPQWTDEQLEELFDFD